MAALSAAAGDEDEAKAYAANIPGVKTKVAALDAEIARLEAKTRKLPPRPPHQ